ncbi:MbcA/ParS/Xre antitoxin family protein [Mucilaginibacter sp. RS28]|uniref:MbcA/ParS/Xre antitoxin family protein n=1 Tax=Mucilaginibacter straminoryzae TaxID=2932774 RepID=A0A9X1X7U0_9SPHI|nr:antitoxin Xre/MbcA/ParS toxin-binding domain-containing protein [Mucilaginibacter straminoryzae]MCJ8210184.1 MbcA/ParS/Xre antitoxin family protein [Mucilaginibacter straminoryzae]
MKKKEIAYQVKEEPLPVVNDFVVPYGNNHDLEQTATYHSFFENPVALLTSSKKGLDAKAALDFINLSGFSHQEFQDTFKTTVKTIQNYAGNAQKLDPSLSEKILKSFALFEKGIEIFGSADVFHKWLNTPAYGLGNQVPFELMDTFTGMTLIEEELIRLEYGDLA